MAGLFVCLVRKEEDLMIIRPSEPEVQIAVDRDPVKTSFEEWARPGHFSRTIAKGPDTTTWIWNNSYGPDPGISQKMFLQDPYPQQF